LLAVLFGIVAFLAAGGGHGTYVPAALLFPGALLLATALTTISDAVLCVGAAQWPLYGAAVGLASRRGYTKEAIAYLGLFHALLVAACFAFDRSGQFLW
jgi:hypothetical protein